MINALNVEHIKPNRTTLSTAQQAPVGEGVLITEVSRSHSRHTTLGRTPLDQWTARRSDFYLTTHKTHNKEISMPRRDSNPQHQQAWGRRHTKDIKVMDQTKNWRVLKHSVVHKHCTVNNCRSQICWKSINRESIFVYSLL